MEYIEIGIKKIFSEDINYNTRRKEVSRLLEINKIPFGNHLVNRFRYINTDTVYIKKKHYVNSYSVVKVNKGDIVKLQFKEDIGKKKRYKNWLYVEYDDLDGQSYTGWINNIYTRKVTRII